MSTLILVRGLPGSGKSTMAKLVTDNVVEADQYFIAPSEHMEEGSYNFDPTKLKEAHEWCQNKTRSLMTADWMGHKESIVAVANTFTQKWEMDPYISMAIELGYRVTVISLFDNGMSDEELFERNIHGVPLEAIGRMRERYEHDWVKKSRQPLTEKYDNKLQALKEEHGEDAVARDILKTIH